MRWSRALFAASLIMLMVMSSFTMITMASNSSNEIISTNSNGASHSYPMFHLLGFDYNVSIYSTRTVTVSPYGVMTLNDTVKFENKDIREFNAFLVFYKLSELAELYNLRILGISDLGYKKQLHWYPYMQIGDYIGFVVILGQYVKKDSSYTVSIYANIRQLPSFELEGDSLVFSLKFSQKILLPYLVNDHITYFKLQDSQAHLLTDRITPSNGTKEGETIYKYAFSGEVLFNMWSPSDETIVNLYWRTTTPIMYVSQVNRDLTFTITGKLLIKDTFYFNVISPKATKPPAYATWRITDVVIGLPKGVSDPIASDDLGKITVAKTASELIPEDYDAYRVSFRTPLVYDGPYKVTLEYELDSGNRWFNYNDTHWNVTIPAIPIINSTVLAVRFSISYPSEYRVAQISGMEIKNYTEYATVGSLGLVVYTTKTFSVTSVDPDENRLLRIVIETNYMPLFDLTVRLFVIVFFLLSILNLSVSEYIRRKEKEKAVELTIEEKKEMESKLNKYLVLYEEYVAAEEALDQFIQSKLTVRKSPKTIRDNLTRLLNTTKKYRDRLKLLARELSADRDVYKIATELSNLEDKINFTRRELIMDWSNFLGGKLGKKELLVRAESQFNDIKRYKQSRNRLLNRLRNIYIVRYAKKK